MAIRIGRIRLSVTALLALMGVYIFDTQGVFCAFAASVVIHELGHLAALRLFKRRVSELRIDLWGLTIRCDKPLSYKHELITAAAGPLASLLFAVLMSATGRYSGTQAFYVVSGLSLIYCIYNALPVRMLDGGSVLFDAVVLISDLDHAERIVCVTSCLVILLLLILGIWLLIITKLNFTLLAGAVGLLISYCQSSGIGIKSKRKSIGCEA